MADRIERRLRQMRHVLRDVEGDRIARYAVHENEHRERDAEERQDAIQQAADDVRTHRFSVYAEPRSGEASPVHQQQCGFSRSS